MKKELTYGRPIIIAGPCSAESPEQLLETASALKDCGVDFFRAGLWKPRTRPGTFEGVGEKGLPWLGKVKKEYGLKVCTEVAGAVHAEKCLSSGIDAVWIGARTTANPFLVKEIAEVFRGTGVPVFVKNPLSPDIDLWIGAVERLIAGGTDNVMAVHRGFPTLENIAYRNSPQWQLAIEFRRRLPDIPLICDPSHIAGDRKYIGELSKRALALGLDGLMIEVHPEPEKALSDAGQQITPAELSAILLGLSARTSGTDDTFYNTRLSELREKIDVIDEELVKLLADRMNASREIGRIKNEHNVAILQSSRWDEVLEKVMSEASSLGLDPEFVKSVFNEIHEASVSEQAKLTVPGSIDA